MSGIPQQHCEVECLDLSGRITAILHIDTIGEKKENEPELLELLSDDEARSWDEPPVQLRENAEYRCRIRLPNGYEAKGWRIRENRLAKQSKIGGDAWSGQGENLSPIRRSAKCVVCREGAQRGPWTRIVA